MTICAHEKECIFGEVINGALRLNEFGEIVEMEWLNTSVVRPNIELDEFIVMPNHFHRILIINHTDALTYAQPTHQTTRGDILAYTQSKRQITRRGVLQYAQSGANAQSGVHAQCDNDVDSKKGVYQYARTINEEGARIRRGVLPYTRTNQDAPNARTDLRSPSQTLGAIVRGFKSIVTKNINTLRNTPKARVWQRNYYEHVIRDENDLNRIREYTANNPINWEMDENHPVELNMAVAQALIF